jgi:hypothetical protein
MADESRDGGEATTREPCGRESARLNDAMIAFTAAEDYASNAVD